MNNITEPLRLAVGSYQAGSGKGCAMNVVSWVNGDQQITDTPACSDPLLACVVQRVNDEICTHRDGDLLCHDCSVQVLDLAHRTIGTALDMSDADRARVYVRLALDEAESVARPDEDVRVTEARQVVARWLGGHATRDQVSAANNAAYAAGHNAAYAAANYAAAATYAGGAAHSATYAAAAYSATYAAYAAGRVDRAHALITRFEQLTGVRGEAVSQTRIEHAVEQMVAAP